MTIRCGRLSVIALAIGFMIPGGILVAEDAAADESDQLRAVVEKVLKTYRQQLIDYATIHCTHMQRQCNLTPAQAGRLQDAARQSAASRAGILRRSMDRFLERINQQRNQRTARFQILNSWGDSLSRSDRGLVLRQSAWLEAVGATLNTDQAAAWKEATRQRTMWRRQAVLDSVLAMLDAQVFLTARQRKNLEPLLGPLVDRQLARQNSMIGLDRGATIVMTAVRSLPRKQIDERLSATQRILWPSSTTGVNIRGIRPAGRGAAVQLRGVARAPQTTTALKNQKTACERHLSLIIELMTVECGLSDKQQRKLTIASKGVVDQLISETRKQATVQEGKPDDAAVPVRVLAPVAQQQVRVRFEPVGGRLQRVQLGVVPRATVLTRSLWTKSVERTVSAEQQKIWKAVGADRRRFQRHAMLQSALITLDEFVLLTPEQYEQISGLAVDLFEKVDLNQFETTGGRGIAQSALRQIAQIPAESLNGILSRAQLKSWTSYLTPFQ